MNHDWDNSYGRKGERSDANAEITIHFIFLLSLHSQVLIGLVMIITG
jgi:hypothetical protein